MSKIFPRDLLKVLVEPLGKKVDQANVEKWSSQFWSVTRKDNSPRRESFVMMFPPPNITGNLHLGHALTAAIQDALIRQRYMQGFQVRWIPGFDHAGLATQNVVENLIWSRDQLTRQQLGREKFTQEVNAWKQTKLLEMRTQINRLGLELDHEYEYFTMDEHSSQSVKEAFKRLFEDGFIYRADKPVFWSEKLNTTLSDIEIERIDGENRYVRTGERVEKRSLPQWFIKADKMARRAVDVVNDLSLEIIPEGYKHSWSSWLLANGVQDWCISRQSWWGHRIPAYKLESANDVKESWVVADSLEQAKDKLDSIQPIMQDPDVLDTWFSSSLLPLSVSGWPNRGTFDQNCATGMFPLDLMETGFDILTYWVTKMVMMSLTLENKIPFKTVLLHGMICDSYGKKMSKSKGNVIDPLDVMDGASPKDLENRIIALHEMGTLNDAQLKNAVSNQKKLFPKGIPQCGADGLRAYLLSYDFQEEIVRVQIMQIDKIRRLSNKIWNIFRYTISMIDSIDSHDLRIEGHLDELKSSSLDPEDSQILAELANCVHVFNESFNQTYHLHHAFISLDTFLTLHLSSNFITKSKSILNDDTLTDQKLLKIKILVTSLTTCSKLLHPYMPHLSEFLYQKLNSCVDKGITDLDANSKVTRLMDKSFPSNLEWKPFTINYGIKPQAEAF